MSGVFLLLSSKTNTGARQDLHNNKQYCLCPHVQLQSKQNESSLRRELTVFSEFFGLLSKTSSLQNESSSEWL